MQLIHPDEAHLLLPLVVSALAGMFIGIERELRHRATGVGTNILIATGACLLTLLSSLVDADSTSRIAANIVQGIGFLGAGVIFRDTTNAVRGLTSAAGIWLTAAIGMAYGYEYYLLGTFCVFVAIVGPRLPWWIMPKHHALATSKDDKGE